MRNASKFKALPPGRIKYSPMEQQLFSLLRRGRHNSKILRERYYKDRLADNFHARETINAALSSLQRKLEFNKAPFKLLNTSYTGPRPQEWWLDDKT